MGEVGRCWLQVVHWGWLAPAAETEQVRAVPSALGRGLPGNCRGQRSQGHAGAWTEWELARGRARGA